MTTRAVRGGRTLLENAMHRSVCAVLAALAVLTSSAAAQSRKYDKFTDSTAFTWGTDDALTVLGAGEKPSCWSQAYVEFDRLADDRPDDKDADALKTSQAKPVLLVLADTSRFRIEGSTRTRAGTLSAKSFHVLYRYPLSDSATAAMARAGKTDVRDDLDHHLTITAAKLAMAGPYCLPAAP